MNSNLRSLLHTSRMFPWTWYTNFNQLCLEIHITSSSQISTRWFQFWNHSRECLSFCSSKESGQVLMNLLSFLVFWQTLCISSPMTPADLSLHLRITFHCVSARIFPCPPSFLLTFPWWSINFTSSWTSHQSWLSQCSCQLLFSNTPAGYIFQKHSSFLLQTLNHSASLCVVFFFLTNCLQVVFLLCPLISVDYFCVVVVL